MVHYVFLGILCFVAGKIISKIAIPSYEDRDDKRAKFKGMMIIGCCLFVAAFLCHSNTWRMEDDKPQIIAMDHRLFEEDTVTYEWRKGKYGSFGWSYKSDDNVWHEMKDDPDEPDQEWGYWQ